MWREAASLIVASTAPSGFKLLLLQRVASSSFMPNLFVFPGGQLDSADASPTWLSSFPALAEFAATAAAARPAQLMPLLAEHATRRVPGELSFRLCALRETFEESGLLLAARGPHQPVPIAEMTALQEAAQWREWQRRVKKDAGEFLALHAALRVLPDVWSLREWSNWLTPGSSKKRFDTAFFLYAAHDGVEQMRPSGEMDATEVADVQWLKPQKALLRHVTGTHLLGPPQIYEIARLCEFNSTLELDKFAAERERFGNQRFCPVIVMAKDGRYAFLPGDFRYPGDEAACHQTDIVKSEEPFEDDTGDLNRLCTTASRVVCNVTVNGHVIPTVLLHGGSKL